MDRSKKVGVYEYSVNREELKVRRSLLLVK